MRLPGLGALFLAVLSATAAEPLPSRERGQVDVLYAVSEDGRLLAVRKPEARSYPFGDARLGYPLRRPRNCSQRAWEARWYRYDAVFNEAALTYGLDPAFLKALGWVESRFNPRAVSRAGALGLMQLMPVTARRLGVKNPFDPVQSIWGGAAYLREVCDEFRSQNMLLMAAVYNAGEPRVRRAVERAQKTPSEVDLWAVVPNIKETLGHANQTIWTWDWIHRAIKA